MTDAFGVNKVFPIGAPVAPPNKGYTMRRIDNSKRLFYIDLLRMVALFHMIFQHGVMTLLKREQLTGALYFFDQIIPICPALFLFLSGFSLTISGRNSISNSKLFRNLRKGGLLILGAALLFLFEHGFQLPDLIFASGILNSIGLLIIICSLLLKVPFKKSAALLLTAASIALFLLLDRSALEIFPFSGGYEPLLPTIIFGFAGFLTGLVFNELSTKNRGTLTAVLAVIGGGGVGYLFYFYGPFNSLYVEETANFITRIFSVKGNLLYLLSGAESTVSSYSATVYNYSPLTFVTAAALLFLLFGIGFFLEPLLKRFLPRFALLPGQHALVNYFFHLTLYAVIISTVGVRIFDKVEFIAILLGVYLLTYLVAAAPGLMRCFLRRRRLIRAGKRGLMLRLQSQ